MTHIDLNQLILDEKDSQKNIKRKLRALTGLMHHQEDRLKKFMSQAELKKAMKSIHEKQLQTAEYIDLTKGLQYKVKEASKHPNKVSSSEIRSIFQDLHQMLKTITPLLSLMKIPMPPQLMAAIGILVVALKVLDMLLDKFEKSPKESPQSRLQ